jgi:hypothetical protein
MSDREKFHIGLLQYALKKIGDRGVYKSLFDIDGKFDSELEFKSIDLYIYESFWRESKRQSKEKKKVR